MQMQVHFQSVLSTEKYLGELLSPLLIEIIAHMRHCCFVLIFLDSQTPQKSLHVIYYTADR